MKPPKNFNFITEPYEYQLESFLFAIKRFNAGLLLDMGLGKSKVSIDVARYYKKFDNTRKVLIVCPATLLYNWENQVITHSEYEPLIISHNDRYERIARLKYDFEFGIINYESLFPTLRDMDVLAKHKSDLYLLEKGEDLLKKLKIDMIIFDESSRYIKTVDTQRTFSSTILADNSRHKMILTGTLIDNYPKDVFAQFRVMDGGRTFGLNYYKFLNFYFSDVGYGNFKKYELKKGRIGLLQKSIYTNCIRKRKEEVLDLPEKIFKVIEVAFDNKSRAMYESVKKKILSEIEIEGGTTVLQLFSILAKLQKLQQITSGFIINQDKSFTLVQTPKLDALKEEVYSILENGRSVVIWCRFLKSIDLISKMLDGHHIKYITLSGADKDKKKRYEKLVLFQNSPTINVFIGQVESGGFGTELFKIDAPPNSIQYCIYYENTWSLATRLQSMDRIHRIGQNSTCMYIDLAIKDTIDMQILESINKNKDVADAVMEKGVKGWVS